MDHDGVDTKHHLGVGITSLGEEWCACLLHGFNEYYPMCSSKVQYVIITVQIWEDNILSTCTYMYIGKSGSSEIKIPYMYICVCQRQS